MHGHFASSMAQKEADLILSKIPKGAWFCVLTPEGKNLSSEELAEKLATVEISIAMQATEDDQLFGSVPSRMVADELAAKDIKIEHSRILIDPPIKSIGSFEADVKLHAEVTAKVKIWVVRG